MVSFPWELLALGKEDSFGRRFFVGRHQRILGQRQNDQARILIRPLLIANPDGSLPDSGREGTGLRQLLGDQSMVTLLSTYVTCDDVLAGIENASLLHYSGHSLPDALILADGRISSGQIEQCRSVPFMVFLNSCSPAAPEGWSQTADNLTKAFQKAGSYVVICPITIVDSRRATAFALAFYHRFLKGDAVGQALSRAATEVDASGFFGANYVLYGNLLLKAKTSRRTLPPKQIQVVAAAILGTVLVAAAAVWNRIPAEPIDNSYSIIESEHHDDPMQ